MRFQLPQRDPLKAVSSTAYVTAQIPRPLYDQGLKPDLLAKLQYLAWRLGRRHQGLRTLTYEDMRLTTTDDERGTFLLVEKPTFASETPLAIPVSVTQGGIVAETVIWQFPLAKIDELKTHIDHLVEILRASFFLHPTSGEVYPCSGKSVKEVQIDPDWYFSDEGAYVLPGLYGHEACYFSHFARADVELGAFRTGNGEVAICRRVDIELAQARARSFYEACTDLLLERGMTSLSLEAEDETSLRKLAWSADKKFERSRDDRRKGATH